MQRSSRRRRGLFDNGRTNERASGSGGISRGHRETKGKQTGVWFVVAVVMVGGGESEQQL